MQKTPYKDRILYSLLHLPSIMPHMFIMYFGATEPVAIYVTKNTKSILVSEALQNLHHKY